jgi:ethanolamine utilization protein EutS
MDYQDLLSSEGKLRIIQEIVPGKQITLAHVIANPDSIVYKKLGLNPSIDYAKAAIGVITMTPAEMAIIAADLATKTANIELGFVDRFSGTLIITGKISEIEMSIKEISNYAEHVLGFTVCKITRT